MKPVQPIDKTILQKCKQTIEELQEQIQHQKQTNQQQKKLINMLTEQKQYYQNECKKYEEQKQEGETQKYTMVREFESKKILVNELKKANQMLKEEVDRLREQVDEGKFMLQAQQQQMDRVKKQKVLLQKQWNRVIKQIKAKMTSKIQIPSFGSEKEIKQSDEPRLEKVNKLLLRIEKNLAERQVDSVVGELNLCDSSTNDIIGLSF